MQQESRGETVSGEQRGLMRERKAYGDRHVYHTICNFLNERKKIRAGDRKINDQTYLP